MIAGASHRAITILVVDDDGNLRREIRRLLEREGYEVKEACNGREASALLDNGSFSLMISDVMMPEQSGVEIFYEVRCKHSLPIILMTGLKGIHDEILECERSLQGLLLKPFGSAELLNAVAVALADAA
jgi:DNA-binding response OmpR family regulator